MMVQMGRSRWSSGGPRRQIGGAMIRVWAGYSEYWGIGSNGFGFQKDWVSYVGFICGLFIGRNFLGIKYLEVMIT